TDAVKNKAAMNRKMAFFIYSHLKFGKGFDPYYGILCQKLKSGNFFWAKGFLLNFLAKTRAGVSSPTLIFEGET
ncbi:MAG: hypothetical protein ACXVLT_12050, partial [Flavisolibacter sp.]